MPPAALPTEVLDRSHDRWSLEQALAELRRAERALGRTAIRAFDEGLCLELVQDPVEDVINCATLALAAIELAR